MDVYYQVKHKLLAPSLDRKFEFSHWFLCGADGKSTYGHVIIKFLGWIDYQNFPRYGASLARGLRARGVRRRYHRSHLALEDTEPLFKILYTFVCFKVSGKITDKYMKNLKEASGEI